MAPEYDELQLKGMFLRLFQTYHGRTYAGRTLLIGRDHRQRNPGFAGILYVKKEALLIKVVFVVGEGVDWFRKLCTLCHELGHFRSWLGRKRPGEYEQLLELPRSVSLSDRAKKLHLDEERRAWRYGYAFASEVGFDDRARYRKEAMRALSFYYEWLDVPPVPFVLRPPQGGLVDARAGSARV